jgi:hypothetical protein
MTAHDLSADASGGTQACKAMGFSATLAETRFRARRTMTKEEQENRGEKSRGERASLDVCHVTCVFDTEPQAGV